MFEAAAGQDCRVQALSAAAGATAGHELRLGAWRPGGCNLCLLVNLLVQLVNICKTQGMQQQHQLPTQTPMLSQFHQLSPPKHHQPGLPQFVASHRHFLKGSVYVQRSELPGIRPTSPFAEQLLGCRALGWILVETAGHYFTHAPAEVPPPTLRLQLRGRTLQDGRQTTTACARSEG